MTSQGRTDASEIFLSPRVVDRDAFEDYCGALRAIVADAQRLGDGLTRQAAQARSAAQELSRAEPEAAAKAGAASRTLAAIDERIDVLKGLIERAESQTRTLGELESRADGLIDRKLGALKASADELVDQAEARLSASAVEATTGLSTAAREAEGAIERACEGAIETASAAVRRIETLGESLGGELADNAAESREQLRQTLADLEERAEPARRALESSVAELEDRIDRLRKQALALMGPGVRELESICERSAALLGREPGSGASPSAGSLADVATRLEQAEARARATLDRFQAAREQADASRSSLSESIVASAQWLDRLSEQHASLEEALARSLERCREAEAAMKSREAELRAALVEPRRRIETDLAALAELRTHLTGSREELEAVLGRHADAAATIREESRRLEGLVERATPSPPEDRTGETDGVGEADGQPARRDPVHQDPVRRDLAEELARMAAAIESLTTARQHVAGGRANPAADARPASRPDPTIDLAIETKPARQRAASGKDQGEAGKSRAKRSGRSRGKA